MGAGRCGGCVQNIDQESMVPLSGEVANLNLGRGFPSFALGDATVMAGSYRVWLDTSFTLEEGDEVEVRSRRLSSTQSSLCPGWIISHSLNSEIPYSFVQRFHIPASAASLGVLRLEALASWLSLSIGSEAT